MASWLSCCTTTDWITAIGTVFAAFGTTAAVVFSLYSLRKEVLRKEKENNRKQAEQITAWLENDIPEILSEKGEDFLKLILMNSSNQLVYHAVAVVVIKGSSGYIPDPNTWWQYAAFMVHIPPGQSETKIKYPGRGMSKRLGIDLAFQDTAGRFWRRREDGVLIEIDKDPVEYYGFIQPAPWIFLK